LIAAGTVGFGLVIGWATGFIGWSWSGIAYRIAAVAGVALGVAGFGGTSALLALVATVIGAAAHDGMLEAIRRRGV